MKAYIIPVVIILVVCSAVFSQSLVTFKAAESSVEAVELFLWKKNIGDVTIAVVPHENLLQQQHANINIVDSDFYSGYFYCLEKLPSADIRPKEFDEHKIGTLLWFHQNIAIIKCANVIDVEQVPASFEITQINTSRTNGIVSPIRKNTISLASVFDDIKDSVSTKRLMTTLMQLTGEEAYHTASGSDTITSRYVYSSGVKEAENYLCDRIEELGYQYELQPVKLKFNLRDIGFSMTNPQRVWIIKDQTIFFTADGGETWEKQLDEAYLQQLGPLEVVNDSVAYVISKSNFRVFKTTDCGAQWEKVDIPLNSQPLNLHFLDPDTGFICGSQGIVLKTENGGEQWTVFTTPAAISLSDLYFFDSSHGYVIGSDSTLIYTENGGSEWTRIENTGLSASVYKMDFVDENVGFVLGEKLFKTIDGGRTWSETNFPHVYASDFDFWDADRGVVALENLWLTNDGGVTWSQLEGWEDVSFRKARFLTENEIWGCGRGNLTVYNINEGTRENITDKLDMFYSNNIIVEKTGTTNPDVSVILCAHYDSRSEISMMRAPGADDNASGCTAVLEAASVLRDYSFGYTIRFIFFTAEEIGLVGSELYAAQAAKRNEEIFGVINLDMIGYDGNDDGIFSLHANGSQLSSQWIGDIVYDNVDEYALSLTPDYWRTNGMGSSDHFSFWVENYPAVMMIEDRYDWNPFYHSTGDISTIINQDYLTELCRLAILSLVEIAQYDSQIDVKADNEKPATFLISEPYPNPFTSAVSIHYRLTEPADVNIQVFNILGQTLFEQKWRPATAIENQFKWNAEKWGGRNGVYFLKFSSGDKTIVKKILHIQ